MNSYKEYIEAFRLDYEGRTEQRDFQIEDAKVTIFSGVFPSDSPYTYSSQSTILTLKKEIEKGVLDSNTTQKILDLGTGSGIFSTYLRIHFPNADITASDISDISLENAQYNFDKNNFHIKLVRSDLFQNLRDKFDIIVTSIPFVDDWNTVPPQQDTLERFWQEVKPHLNSGAIIYFNWADWANFEKMEALAQKSGFKIIHFDEYPLPLGKYMWRTYKFVHKI